VVPGKYDTRASVTGVIEDLPFQKLLPVRNIVDEISPARVAFSSVAMKRNDYIKDGLAQLAVSKQKLKKQLNAKDAHNTIHTLP
jgi:hypothetical protein